MLFRTTLRSAATSVKDASTRDKGREVTYGQFTESPAAISYQMEMYNAVWTIDAEHSALVIREETSAGVVRQHYDAEISRVLHWSDAQRKLEDM